jgi:hypothetical protein
MTPATIPTIPFEGIRLTMEELKQRCLGAVRFWTRPVTAAEIWHYVDPFDFIPDQARAVALNSLVFERQLVVDDHADPRHAMPRTTRLYRLRAEERRLAL